MKSIRYLYVFWKAVVTVLNFSDRPGRNGYPSVRRVNLAPVNGPVVLNRHHPRAAFVPLMISDPASPLA